MGREVKRVPAGFSWPLNKVWFGYVLDAIPCELCHGAGKRANGPTKTWCIDPEYSHESDYCEVCEGGGTIVARIELPNGFAYQMWETTSEGSPISPPFDTPEELAEWLANSGASACGGSTATYAQWLAMIKDGWAPTMVSDSKHGLRSGVEAAADVVPAQP